MKDQLAAPKLEREALDKTRWSLESQPKSTGSKGAAQAYRAPGTKGAGRAGPLALTRAHFTGTGKPRQRLAAHLSARAYAEVMRLGHCFRCGKGGHTFAVCTNAKACAVCAQADHDTNDCPDLPVSSSGNE